MKNTYTSEQKQTIIERYISGGETYLQISADTGIAKSTFYSWLKQYNIEKETVKKKIVNYRNFMLLENKVAQLENMVDILKSVGGIVDIPLREKLYLAERFYNEYSVHLICETLDIPRGTFYNHILRNKKDNTWYAKRKEELRLRIQEIYDENRQIFGADKIATIMKNEGIAVSKEMVRKLMREMGIGSVRQNAKKLYEDESKKHKNYLNQQFDTHAPNEVWVSDVTYFKFNEKAYYICVVIDLFSRKVISYKVGKKNSTQLVTSTLKMAYEDRKPNSSLIYHTDRGFNFCSRGMAEYIKSIQITHSFSRPYVPYDNSVVESFFASLKREELYRTKYRSESEFMLAVSDYMDFFNTKRPHRKLQYRTPEQKEHDYALNNGLSAC
ncbi:MAG: IS3 family transposase [Clostridia bacterium]|nr:IS3 family transposase [Clostridia bacterium]